MARLARQARAPAAARAVTWRGCAPEGRLSSAAARGIRSRRSQLLTSSSAQIVADDELAYKYRHPWVTSALYLAAAGSCAQKQRRALPDR